MEKWSNPQVKELKLSKTMQEVDSAAAGGIPGPPTNAPANGTQYICIECCKTSNMDEGYTPLTSLHEGHCSGHKNKQPTEEHVLSLITVNDGTIVCRS